MFLPIILRYEEEAQDALELIDLEDLWRDLDNLGDLEDLEALESILVKVLQFLEDLEVQVALDALEYEIVRKPNHVHKYHKITERSTPHYVRVK